MLPAVVLIAVLWRLVITGGNQALPCQMPEAPPGRQSRLLRLLLKWLRHLGWHQLRCLG